MKVQVSDDVGISCSKFDPFIYNCVHTCMWHYA